MDTAASFTRSDLEAAYSSELVSAARSLRRDAQRLRRDAERLRFEHKRVRQAVRRRRDTAEAWRKPVFVPSPWSPLLWQLPSENFEDVLTVVS